MSTSRVFGPHSSDGIPVSAGQKLSVRVVQASGVTRTLDRLQFGISQLETEGSGGVLLPVLGDGGGGGWTPVVEPSVYSGSADETVRKVNFGTSELWSFTGHTDTVRDVAVDPDGNVYTDSSDDSVRKIDSSGVEVWSFTGHTDRVSAVAVDPDGNVYTGSNDDTVRKIDSSGAQVWSFTGHTAMVLGVAVDPGIYGAFG